MYLIQPVIIQNINIFNMMYTGSPISTYIIIFINTFYTRVRGQVHARSRTLQWKMAFVKIAAWEPEEVAEWLRGQYLFIFGSIKTYDI